MHHHQSQCSIYDIMTNVVDNLIDNQYMQYTITYDIINTNQ